MSAILKFYQVFFKNLEVEGAWKGWYYLNVNWEMRVAKELLLKMLRFEKFKKNKINKNLRNHDIKVCWNP